MRLRIEVERDEIEYKSVNSTQELSNVYDVFVSYIISLDSKSRIISSFMNIRVNNFQLITAIWVLPQNRKKENEKLLTFMDNNKDLYQ